MEETLYLCTLPPLRGFTRLSFSEALAFSVGKGLQLLLLTMDFKPVYKVYPTGEVKSLGHPRVVFLDIDGVVAPAGFRQGPTVTEYQVTYPTVEAVKRHLQMLSPEHVARVNRVAKGATVVCCSAWTSLFDASDLTWLLRQAGATFSVKDALPCGIPRWDAIRGWIRDNSPDSFVILDDGWVSEDLTPNHIRPKINVGLTEDEALSALRILNGQTHFAGNP